MTGVDTSVPVVIVKRLPYPLQAAAVGIARSLGRWGVPVHLFGDRPGSPLAVSRYVSGVLAERAADGDEAMVAQLLGADVADGAMLVPVDDPAALFVADHADVLARRYRLPEQPRNLARRLADKRTLVDAAHAAGVAVPRSTVPETGADVASFVEAVGLPVVVKAGDPERLRREEGQASVTIARTLAHARSATARLLEDRPNVLLQEYIPGGPLSVWMVNAYIDRAGACAFAGVGRKLRQYPIGTGATTLGLTDVNDDVLAAAVRLLTATGYRGIVDMGFRHDARDGAYKLLDVNPRIGATFRLFATERLDVVRAMYLDLTGQELRAERVAAGRRWWLEPWDLAGAFASWRAGDLALSEYLRSLRDVEECGLFAWDDPTPVTQVWRVGLPRIADAARTALQDSRPDGPGRTASGTDVAAWFDRRADYWNSVYAGSGPDPSVYRDRAARAVEIVRDLRLPPEAGVLELGCGAGRMTRWLAQQGWSVTAVDASTAMIAAAKRRLTGAGLDGRVQCRQGDAHRLEEPDGAYQLVVALGVLPWLTDSARALAEMRRVLAPGGHALITADNRYRLSSLADPVASPLVLPVLAAARRAVAAACGLPPPTVPLAASHSRADVEALVRQAGLELVRTEMVGFGPPTFGGRPLLPGRAGTAVHRRLQAWADRGVPLLGRLGSHHVVLARRPAAGGSVAVAPSKRRASRPEPRG